MIYSARPVLRIALFALASVCASARLAAQVPQESPSDGAAHGARVVDPRLPEDAVTKGTVALRNGQHLPYTAQAGILTVAGADAQDLNISAPDKLTGVVSVPDGSAIAAMSYVAYFADNVDQRKRPIVFLYDGGPSVSTRTLLMASFGPVVADLPGLHHFAGGPYNFDNNVDSLLDVADLVFVDPPGTGYGHIQGRDAAGAFYGVDGDAAAFDRFIRRFLSQYSRWESPKYRHSYGTVRNAVLARVLEEDGVDLNGIIADGSFLNQDDFQMPRRAYRAPTTRTSCNCPPLPPPPGFITRSWERAANWTMVAHRGAVRRGTVCDRIAGRKRSAAGGGADHCGSVGTVHRLARSGVGEGAPAPAGGGV